MEIAEGHSARRFIVPTKWHNCFMIVRNHNERSRLRSGKLLIPRNNKQMARWIATRRNGSMTFSLMVNGRLALPGVLFTGGNGAIGRNDSAEGRFFVGRRGTKYFPPHPNRWGVRRILMRPAQEPRNIGRGFSCSSIAQA